MPLGTTAYAMFAMPSADRAKTIESLRASPFNKLRIQPFPKNSPYTHHQPWAYPFPIRDGGSFVLGEDTDWDLGRFNLDFWREFDAVIDELERIPAIAEILIFNDDDHGAWGFDRMNLNCEVGEGGRWCDHHYVRYLVARVGAFNNVWWTMTSEWQHLDEEGVK